MTTTPIVTFSCGCRYKVETDEPVEHDEYPYNGPCPVHEPRLRIPRITETPKDSVEGKLTECLNA